MAGIQPGGEPGKYYVKGATWEVIARGTHRFRSDRGICDLAALPPGPVAQVGRRYELFKLLGEGSFSQVALALDRETGEKVCAADVCAHAAGAVKAGSAKHPKTTPHAQVALKRIPDVLQSLENAKRVLREVRAAAALFLGFSLPPAQRPTTEATPQPPGQPGLLLW